MDPQLTVRTEEGRPLPVLMWRFATGRTTICSGPLGGGLGRRDWLLNATVPLDYARRDPDRHLTWIADALGLPGTGAGLLTAVDVTRHATATDTGVHATATVGLSSPAWAAAPDGHFRRELPARHGHPDGFHNYRLVEYRPGTINVVVAVPVTLAPAALVNAVVTATEAKTQALVELGVRATGTASDAVCVHCPPDGPAQQYGGPRSTWGARLARAVHAAVRSAARDWLDHPVRR